jgi:hypothetical protein
MADYAVLICSAGHALEDAMRRRTFIFGIAASAAWPLVARAQQSAGVLQKAKHDYEKIPHPSEAARSDYITSLVSMRENAVRLNTSAWQAIDASVASCRA